MLLAFAALTLASITAFAQSAAHPVKADLPTRDEIRYGSVTQESDGTLKHLHGAAYIQTSEMRISADEIDFDADTDWAHAHGNVHMEHYVSGDKINADHGEYNLRTDEGKFYVVTGTSPAKVLTSPGVLTTTNPFYFEAKSADRFKDRYVLHQGFLTDCKLPKPWWLMQAPLFDVIPGNRAFARNAVFRFKRFPILYLPYFYRPLGRNPRQSGFLTPNFGHSSQFGWVYGLGYYWALNRSYDMTAIAEYFSLRGPAVTYDFRGKPSDTSDFHYRLYDVQDQGAPRSNGKVKQGGREFEFSGSAQVLGFTGRADYNYLSTFTFRQVFSYTFASAVNNEVGSIGFLQRRFANDMDTLSIVAQRTQDYVATTPLGAKQNEVVVEKLPSIEFVGRDQNAVKGPVPIWFSFNSSAGLLIRDEPTGRENVSGPAASELESGAVGRLNVAPHVYTAFQLHGVSIEPGVTLQGTDYTNSYAVNRTSYGPIQPCSGYGACPPTPTTQLALANNNVFRTDADFTLDLRLPTLERIYTPAKWLHLGAKVKHVLETQATYEILSGLNQYNRILHFDATDILSDTNQLTINVTNRLLRKDKNGNANEFLTWKVKQARYFNPTFGGAAVPGQRTAIAATEDLSPYAFLDGPRAYSPIVSVLTVNPYSFFGLDWRAEYDPLRQKMVVDGLSGTYRRGKWYASMGETSIRTNPLLFPQSNQLTFSAGYGSYSRKGWNVGLTELYDVLLHRPVFTFLQGSYNTDCCGFSAQYRRISFGIRNENQYLFSFSLANLGTFGSLQKQERIF